MPGPPPDVRRAARQAAQNSQGRQETGCRELTDEDPAVSVYDGRVLVGLIFDRSTGCVATDAGRRPLGRFATWREASVAIHEARRALEVT